MDLQTLRDLLARWARWVVMGNKTTMGYALPGYAELVGRGSFGDDYGIDIDPLIAEIDRSFKLLPPSLRQVIWLHYVIPGQAKSKHDPGQSRAYFAKKKLAEEALLSVHVERMQQKQVAHAPI